MLTPGKRDDIIVYGQIYHTVLIILSFVNLLKISDWNLINYPIFKRVTNDYRGRRLISFTKSLCVILLILFLIDTKTEDLYRLWLLVQFQWVPAVVLMVCIRTDWLLFNWFFSLVCIQWQRYWFFIERGWCQLFKDLRLLLFILFWFDSHSELCFISELEDARIEFTGLVLRQ